MAELVHGVVAGMARCMSLGRGRGGFALWTLLDCRVQVGRRWPRIVVWFWQWELVDYGMGVYARDPEVVCERGRGAVHRIGGESADRRGYM